MTQQGALADRADAVQLVEHRVAHRLVAPLAMELDREPVRLVAHALKQPQRLGVARDRHQVRAARQEHLLDPLRQPDDGGAALGERASARIPAESWPLPPSITISPGSVAKLPSRSASCGERSAWST